MSDEESTFRIDSHGTWDSERLYRERDGRTPETREGDSADEVDPTKLVSQPDLNQIRWFYRNGHIAPTIVDKPIDDVFKYGFDVENDPTDSVKPLLDSLQWDMHYQNVQKKARRDGFAILLAITRDNAAWYEPPSEADTVDLVKLKEVTVDQLGDSIPDDTELPEGYDATDIEVTDDGLVIARNFDRPTEFDDLLGVVFDPGSSNGTNVQSRFIHRERFFIYTWRGTVDGNVEDVTFGQYQGDSVLQPIIHLLKSLAKGNWAAMQALFRHSSPLHVMNTPEGVDEDKWNEANTSMRNINSKSSFTLPPGDGWEIEAVEGGDVIDPEPHYDAYFDQICAGTEMTRSVLFGTQAGTVSGSETDIKNYYNQVERLRHGRVEGEMREFVRRVNSWDKSLIPNLALGFQVEWGPLFKLSQLDQNESMSRSVQAISNAVGTYVLTPTEARNILEEKWAEAELDLDLEELEEEDYDQLDRVNTTWGKQYGEGNSPEDELPSESNRASTNNSGGRTGGEDENSDTPNTN